MGARRQATFRAPCASTSSTPCASARSVELEAFGAHESTEIGTLRYRILPGLVLRPAVVGAFTEPLGVALRLVGLNHFATPIVGSDLLLETALIIAVAMNRDIEAKPRAHYALERRPTGTQRRHREDMLRQIEDVGNLYSMVTDGTDRTAAQSDPVGGGHEGRQHNAGIDGRVEERIEIVVHERPAPPFEQQSV